MKNDKYHTFEIIIYYEVNKPKKLIKKGEKNKNKKHKNVWITFAFVFQRRKTNVMLDEHEFYVLWLGVCVLTYYSRNIGGNGSNYILVCLII